MTVDAKPLPTISSFHSIFCSYYLMWVVLRTRGRLLTKVFHVLTMNVQEFKLWIHLLLFFSIGSHCWQSIDLLLNLYEIYSTQIYKVWSISQPTDRIICENINIEIGMEYSSWFILFDSIEFRCLLMCFNLTNVNSVIVAIQLF